MIKDEPTETDLQKVVKDIDIAVKTIYDMHDPALEDVIDPALQDVLHRLMRVNMILVDDVIPHMGKANIKYVVKKKIWLEMIDIDNPTKLPTMVGWTTKEPKYNNGYISAGTILTFSHYYRNARVFSTDDNALGVESGAEFFNDEIEELVEQKVLQVI